MSFGGNPSNGQLTALLIAPDRALARQFSAALPATSGFQILAELKVYPPQQTLEMRLRQLQPQVVLLDMATSFDQAAEVIRHAIAVDPALHVIGLHTSNDSDVILRALRHGASEFLSAPFDSNVERQALARLRRLICPQPEPVRCAGKVIVFTSAKPGSGASTIAAQLALTLRCKAGKKVLLADLDPLSATVSFYLRLPEREPADADLWNRVVATPTGLDAMPAFQPGDPVLPSSLLHEFVERARTAYDWIILDLPAVFHRASLLALPEADMAFLVTTPELPSLHLARKAVNLLSRLGFGKERVQAIVNRVERRSGLATSDVERILNAPVRRSFVNDYFSIDRALMEGEPLAAECELGKEIEEFARKLAAAPEAGPRQGAGAAAAETAHSVTRT